MSERNPTILIVEDDFVDIEAIKRGIRKRQLAFNVEVKHDGRQALEYLRNSDLPRDDRGGIIVFLDINMPGMNGHQFLEELRQDQLLRQIIVFVLSTSDHALDKSKAYDKNVAGYFIKSNVDGLLDTVSHYAQNVKFPPV